MKTLTKNLRTKGITLNEFAFRMGISRQHCYNLAKLKKKSFSVKQLKVIKECLGENWEELLNEKM